MEEALQQEVIIDEPETVAEIDEIPAPVGQESYVLQRIVKLDHSFQGEREYLVASSDGKIQKGRLHLIYDDANAQSGDEGVGWRNSVVEKILQKADGSYWIFCTKSIYIYRPKGEAEPPEDQPVEQRTGLVRRFREYVGRALRRR